MFPVINHINDVLGFIEDKDEFSIRDKGEYQVIDYAVSKEDTFDSPEARECRGIKFFNDGSIAFRPFHKFFNHGERKDLEEQYFNEDFRMFEKLDGSLLHFLPVNGEQRAMTKGGITDVSEQAERELSRMVEDIDVFKKVYERFYSMGYCIMFEYTSPINRIVIRHDKPSLTLIGVREIHTGEYYPLDMFAEHLRVPKAQEFDPNDLHQVKEWKDKEGVVLVWKSGYSLKVKADDYVLKHKTKDQLNQEKNVLQFVLDDSVDDLAGILDEDDFIAVKRFTEDVEKNITDFAGSMNLLRETRKEWYGDDRKSHALDIKNQSKLIQIIYWKMFGGQDAEEAVRSVVKKNLTSQTKVDGIREIIAVRWEDYV